LTQLALPDCTDCMDGADGSDTTRLRIRCIENTSRIL
jgi:hypothetical protein